MRREIITHVSYCFDVPKVVISIKLCLSNFDVFFTIRHHREYYISHAHPGYTGSCLVFTPVSNPLTLCCDHFDRGSDHSKHEHYLIVAKSTSSNQL